MRLSGAWRSYAMDVTGAKPSTQGSASDAGGHTACIACNTRLDAKGVMTGWIIVVRSRPAPSSPSARWGKETDEMCRFFISKVTKARYRKVSFPERQPADMRIEFQAWVSGWRRAERQTQLQGLLEKTDDQLLVATERCSDKLMLFLPQILFPESDDKAEFGDNGWWYTPMRIERIAMCVRCGKNCTMEQFPIEDGEQRTSCLTCAQTRRRQRKAVKWMWTGERNGLVCTLADPRYAGRGDDRSGGDVVMDAGRLRQVLEHTSAMAEGDMILWLTTGEMGHALAAEDAELVEERDVRAGRETGRWIAPQIEEFISTLREGASQLEADERQEESTLRVELLTMLADWGQPHPQRNAETAQDRQVRKCVMAVSYTHLTLPTICSV